MELTVLDLTFFVLFVGFVITFAMYMSRKKKDSTEYFLAGRAATWPLIGFSLIAANISTEHFVGMSGQGAGMAGLAIASYEWIAAITLVFVALFFLPRFLRAGIFTIPEYLEYRYNATCRLIMSFFMLIMIVFVTTVSVVYSGGIAVRTFFGDYLQSVFPNLTEVGTLMWGIWLIGLAAAIYSVFGGLKAVIWADLFQGSALIVGGAIVLGYTLNAIGGFSGAMEHEYVQERMHVAMPADHPIVPWTILVLGIWIPNFYYWGLNQFITQRTLAAKTLREGQLGVIFAAGLKLLIPFIIVMPGIMAPVLFPEQLPDAANRTSVDEAYPTLIRELVGPGWRGFILAALAGAVVSSLASMLNSASTIFTMDVYKRLYDRAAPQRTLVTIGRVTTIICLIIACLMAPMLRQERFQGVFNYIQEFQGMFTPGILAAFIFGFAVRRAPALAAIVGLIACPIISALMKWPAVWILQGLYEFPTPQTPAAEVLAGLEVAPGAFVQFLGFLHDLAFLNRMAITFVIVLIVMGAITIARPLAQPVTMPVQADFDMKPSRAVTVLGLAVIAVTVALYLYFW